MYFDIVKKTVEMFMKKLIASFFIFSYILSFFFLKDIQARELPKVLVKTNYGSFTIEVDTQNAPKTAGNFLFYVKSGFYNKTIFHRVIDGFMIQGGGLTENMQEKNPIKKPIQNEAANGLLNKKYTVSMARTNDPHSATTQFFINVEDNKALDYKSPTPSGYGYTVFGQVISGQKVIDLIKQVPTHTVGMHNDVPISPVIIESMEIIPDGEKEKLTR